MFPIQQRALMMEESLRKAGLQVIPGEEQTVISLLEAIKIIQKHERARQGRAKVALRKQLIARQVVHGLLHRFTRFYTRFT